MHSRWQPISRRRATIVLALDPADAVLSIDGRQRASLGAASTPRRRRRSRWAPGARLPSSATGYLDIDNVTVRSAPDAT